MCRQGDSMHSNVNTAQATDEISSRFIRLKAKLHKFATAV